MGLDDFSTGQSTTSRSTTRNRSSQTSSQSEDDEPFKVVSGNRGREKVFPTEEDWEKTKEFIEDEMGKNANEVLNMNPSDRHDILHQAILRINGADRAPFHTTNECIVCGKVFTFPGNWNFTRLRGEAVCNDHTIDETMKAIGAVNAIKG